MVLTILNKIMGFLKKCFSKENLPFTFFVCLILFIGITFYNCDKIHTLKKEKQNSEMINQNNISALKDSIKVYVDKKTGNLIADKASYILNTLDDLKKYDVDLYNDFKSQKNLIAGIKTGIDVIIPTLTSKINKPIVDKKDSTKFTIPWKFEYNDKGLSQKLIGSTQFNILNNKPIDPIISVLDTNYFKVNLTYSFRSENNKYIIQAVSPSPLVKFNELDGALILDQMGKIVPSKPSPKLSVGLNINYGLNFDNQLNDPRLGWGIGVGVSYRLFGK